jgi:hypothetical protein
VFAAALARIKLMGQVPTEDFVYFEAKLDVTGDSECMWLLVSDSDD